MSNMIDEIKIESEGPDGWWLYIHTDTDDYRFRIGMPDQIKAEVDRTIGAWLAEGEAVRATMTSDRLDAAHQRLGVEVDSGYALDDPKHPTYHDRMSDAADFGELD